ncbi:MAG: hypothetical protein O3A46_00380 [Candidatus Poribacteria bacterium]|nr:hypothetical protein [Candidatus Poribacteria bacterium]
MNRQEFVASRDLPGKVIRGDIRFEPEESDENVFRFRGIPVENALDWDVTVHGRFHAIRRSVTFVFVESKTGAICRLDVNSKVHRKVGQTHKHDLRYENDPSVNLPTAVARPDLHGKRVGEIWTILCEQAKITHEGRFIDPFPEGIIP